MYVYMMAVGVCGLCIYTVVLGVGCACCVVCVSTFSLPPHSPHSVARHWKVMLEESSKQPLSDCIEWTHYSYNQVHPSLQPTQFGQ